MKVSIMIEVECELENVDSLEELEYKLRASKEDWDMEDVQAIKRMAYSISEACYVEE